MLKVETMLAMLKDGKADAIDFALPYVIKYFEKIVERGEDLDLDTDEVPTERVEDTIITAFWQSDNNELICSECGTTNFSGKVYDICPSCNKIMMNCGLITERIIAASVKCEALCNLCAFGDGCHHLGHDCGNCEQSCRCCDNKSDFLCRCDMISNGEECPYFKLRECSCGGC